MLCGRDSLIVVVVILINSDQSEFSVSFGGLALSLLEAWMINKRASGPARGSTSSVLASFYYNIYYYNSVCVELN